MVTHAVLKLMLRGFRWDAQKNGLRFEEALRAACQARLTENNTGLILIDAKGNGSSVTFGIPQLASSLSPEAIMWGVSNLYDRYEAALSDLSTDGITVPSDDQILARMLLLLMPRNRVKADYSEMTLV